MDENEIREIEGREATLLWFQKYIDTRQTILCDWVSSFHPQRLECELHGPDSLSDQRGDYNIVSKARFLATDETWAVRFPHNGNEPISDERLEVEVAAINVVRRHTDIPVPEVKAWGYARDNTLGLGPFLISAWVDGIGLSDILLPRDRTSRLFRDDIAETTIRRLWRQIAHFMLQLSRINFEHIGSCCPTMPRRPLSIKSHRILEDGVEIFCPPNKTFTSSTEYFNSIVDHDLRRLYEKPNSVDDAEDARQKFINWTVLRKLVTRFISHDHGPFKLICDDFGPLNMIVNNLEDLQIIAVLDWEWSYSGPSELFWSPPVWLLGRHPVHWQDDDPLQSQYLKNLDLWIEIMQEEEGELNNGTDDDVSTDLPSTIIRKQRQDGSMWFYHIIQEANNGPTSLPFGGLQASVPDYLKLAAEVSEEKIEEFVRLKMDHLQRYEEELAQVLRQRDSPS